MTRIEKRSIRVARRRRPARSAAALPRHAVLAVAGARDLARPGARSPISSSCARGPISRSTASADFASARSSAISSRRGWPEAVQALWRETLVAFVLLRRRRSSRAICSSAAIRAGSTRSCPNRWREDAIPPATRRVAARDDLRAARSEMLATFATFLFTHNARSRSSPSRSASPSRCRRSLLIVYNGLMLGALLRGVRRARGWASTSAAGWRSTARPNCSRSRSPARPGCGSAPRSPFRGGCRGPMRQSRRGAGRARDGRGGGDAGGRRAARGDRAADGRSTTCHAYAIGAAMLIGWLALFLHAAEGCAMRLPCE